VAFATTEALDEIARVVDGSTSLAGVGRSVDLTGRLRQ